jgi:hypothetical protein
MGTRRIAAIILLVAFAAGIALDKLWLAEQAPYFSNALLIRPGVTAFGSPVLGAFAFGVLTPLLLTLLVLVIVLFPWTHASYPVARKERFLLMRGVAIRMLLLPLWILGMAFIYMLAKPYLPGAVAVVLESFGFKPSLHYWAADGTHQLLGPFDGSVACTIGLAAGLLLVYYKFPR